MSDAPSTSLTLLEVVRAASKLGELAPLPPTRHCDYVWSSDPNIVQEERGGWTRSARCGICGASLSP